MKEWKPSKNRQSHYLKNWTTETNFSTFYYDCIPARLHHWSSAAPDCLPSATELFRSLLLVSGTVCLNMSLPHLLWLSSGPISRHICLTYRIPTPCDCTVPVQWRSLLSDTIIVLVTYLLTFQFLKFEVGSVFRKPKTDISSRFCTSLWPTICIS